jgi:NNP family nitrate/nitrite transporter-like MFS transporter
MISLFAKKIEVDEDGKATNISIFSLRRPHMRAFHFSWLSFMVAFTGWFAVPPLITTLKKDINLTAAEIGNANVSSVSATIAARIAVGPLCDRYGPKRVMASILIMGAIATGLIGFVSTGTGLIINRFFIGILGATFVPCQFWTTKMFSSNVVGTANAIAGGWGNMGGGVTYLLMPQLYNLFALALPLHSAWRVAMVVPALICIIVGVLDYLVVDDCPSGDWLELKRAAISEKADATVPVIPVINETVNVPNDMEKTGEKGKQVSETAPATYLSPQTSMTANHEDKEGFMGVMKNFILVFKDPVVTILMVQYACTFGLELAVDNMIGEFFHSRFTNLDQTTSGYLGSIFGLLNIFSRASGGFFADWLNKFIDNGLVGRILAQLIIIFLEGIALIAFSFSTGTMGSAIAVMILFSYFVQAGCGTTFSLAPFVNPKHYGLLTGLVGAGGNLGGVIFNYVFKAYGTDHEGAFKTIGSVVFCVSLLSLVTKVEGQTIWRLFAKKSK